MDSLAFQQVSAGREALVSLQEEIEDVLEPYTESRRKPDLSVAELAVMAILCSPKKNVTDYDISSWLVQEFPYYKTIANETFHALSHGRWASNWHSFYKTMKKDNMRGSDLAAFYDIPIAIRWGPERRFLQVDPYEGRVFLGRLLEPKREGAFRLLDLPVEIRVVIYEYVLSFPASGLGFFGLDKKFKPWTENRLLIQRAEKSDRGTASTKHWARALRRTDFDRPHDVKNNYLKAPPMDDVLALLSVNKQIYEEAMPYFYRYNHFHVDDLYSLAHLLGGCGAKRRQHLTSISFGYGPSKGTKVAVKCFRWLKEVNSLRCLQIDAEDAESGQHLPPAIDALKKIHAQKVEFIGECAEIEVYLKEAMEKPSMEIEAVPKKRKRAAKRGDSAPTVDDEQAKPAKKPKKVAVVDTSLGHWVLSGQQKTRRSVANIKERQEALRRMKEREAGAS